MCRVATTAFRTEWKNVSVMRGCAHPFHNFKIRPCWWPQICLKAHEKSKQYERKRVPLVSSKIEKVPRGIQGEKSGKEMTSSRNPISTIGAQVSPKNGGRNQVSGRVSVPCWCATAVAHHHWSHSYFDEGQARYQGHEIGGKSDWSRIRMSFNIRERETSYCWIRSPYRPYDFLNDGFKGSTRYHVWVAYWKSAWPSE